MNGCKISVFLFSLLIAILCCGCSAEHPSAAVNTAEETETIAAEDEPQESLIDSDFTPTAALSCISDAQHAAIMLTDADGNFFPDADVSRADFCVTLASLLNNLPQGACPYEDVAEGEYAYSAAASLYAGDILPWSADYPLQPDAAITLDEVSIILQRTALSMQGEEADRVSELADQFSGAAFLTRAELAYIGETILNREPSEGALVIHECLPSDVSIGDYCWNYIADAVCDEVLEIPAEGVYRAYGSLYGVWQDGMLIRDLDYGVWAFDANGRYTTGDEELDGYLEAALEDSGANDLEDNDEALRAAYLYVKYNFSYIVTPADMETIDTGVTGWEYERALRFFQYSGGTCYGYAAVFGLMARMLGKTAYIVSAGVNENAWPHGFVVIPEDGNDWIYDPELEATRLERHADFDLFRIQNFTIYNYWYDPDW